MSSVMKLDIDVSTEKAKKSLQQLAKDTSKNLQVQQTRTQQNFQRGQQQGGKGHSNLLGLAALGTSMVALSNTTKQQSEQLVKNNKELDLVNKQLANSGREITEFGETLKIARKEFEEFISELETKWANTPKTTPKDFGNMRMRTDYREYIENLG